MKYWKKISSKVILDHPRMKVVEDMVELPNGKITDYVKIENFSKGVAIICKNNDGKFLLQLEYSYPPNELLWQFPGGAVKAEEDIEVGANRELMEEAKYRAKKLNKLGFFYTNNRRTDQKAWVFLATDLIDDAAKEDDEEVIESEWFTEEEIDQKIRTNEIKNYSVLAAWSLYKAKKRDQGEDD